MKIFITLLLASVFITACNDRAGINTEKPKYLLSHIAINPTAPGVTNSAAHFLLKNNSGNTITIVGAESDIANRVEIHEHTMVNGLMTMGKADPISVAPDEIAEFVPGAYHVMFMGVREFIKAGDQIVFNLLLANGEKIVITAVAHAHDGDDHGY